MAAAVGTRGEEAAERSQEARMQHAERVSRPREACWAGGCGGSGGRRGGGAGAGWGVPLPPQSWEVTPSLGKESEVTPR